MTGKFSLSPIFSFCAVGGGFPRESPPPSLLDHGCASMGAPTRGAGLWGAGLWGADLWGAEHGCATQGCANPGCADQKVRRRARRGALTKGAPARGAPTKVRRPRCADKGAPTNSVLAMVAPTTGDL